MIKHRRNSTNDGSLMAAAQTKEESHHNHLEWLEKYTTIDNILRAMFNQDQALTIEQLRIAMELCSNEAMNGQLGHRWADALMVKHINDAEVSKHWEAVEKFYT